MALNGDEIVFFMSIGVSPTPIPDQSFEEFRLQDYIKAYQSTGQPPLPCPTSPDTPSAHKPSRTSNTSGSPATHPTELPASHTFQPTKSLLDECFQSISAQTLYSHFSHEELRHYAYLAGTNPPISPATAMTNGGVTAAQVHPFVANDSSATAYLTSNAVPGPEYMMCISASPKFDKHSIEELRIAYLLAGKEVGSTEMLAPAAVPPQPAPGLFGRPRGFSSINTLKLF
ncbi:hypothetical protein BU15DRAFT_65027 [Melanogaster broomeanus]|nr:hypothetical protein BU15DRAFT_65027 [Melanogaster broomeanus]